MTLSELTASETLREGSIPVLKTSRLILRAPRLEDANSVAVLANDRRIAENTARIPHPYKLADASQWLAQGNKSDRDVLFVVSLPDGRIIGACGVGLLEGPLPELGYWLGTEFWGKGYATEAVRAVIDYAFEELQHDGLQAGARVTNPTSRRVLEKCGFQWTGVGLYRIRALGSSAPIDRFRLERAIWASLKTWAAVRKVA